MLQAFAPNKVQAADIMALREFTDLFSDVTSGMGLLLIGLLLIRQHRQGAIDLPLLIVRRELACMLVCIAMVRLLDVFARASLWFDVLSSGLRVTMAAMIALVALHAVQRFRALYPTSRGAKKR